MSCNLALRSTSIHHIQYSDPFASSGRQRRLSGCIKLNNTDINGSNFILRSSIMKYNSNWMLSCLFVVLFKCIIHYHIMYLAPVISVFLLTHLVQWAVSVGEVKGFQAVGLTQEVVEMLNAKQNIRHRVRKAKMTPYCTTWGSGRSPGGFVSRLMCWWPQWEMLSNVEQGKFVLFFHVFFCLILLLLNV